MPVLPANPGGGASEMEALYEEDESMEAAPAETEASESEAQPITDLLDKKLLGGQEVAPGDRIILEVVAVNGDGVEVKYASEEAEESGEMSEDDQLAELSK